VKRKPGIAIAAGILAGGLVVACFLRVGDAEWTFQRLICRQTSIPTSVSDIQWERDDPLRVGILLNWGEHIYRGSFTIPVTDFDQLRKTTGFTAFQGDFVPGGGGTLPGWFLPNPQAGDCEIYSRHIGQGQEYLWRRTGQTNACYLLFDI